MAKNSLRKLFEAGVQFHEMSRQQAEAAVKKMVKAGDVRRSEAEATVQALIERSRETALAIAEAVQNEVTKQLGWLANRVDDVEDQMETLVSRFSPLAGPAASGTTTSAAPAKKAAAKKAPAKRAARSSTARKAPAKKKAAAKRSTTRTSTTKKRAGAASGAVGSSGVRKVATSRPG